MNLKKKKKTQREMVWDNIFIPNILDLARWIAPHTEKKKTVTTGLPLLMKQLRAGLPPNPSDLLPTLLKKHNVINIHCPINLAKQKSNICNPHANPYAGILCLRSRRRTSNTSSFYTNTCLWPLMQPNLFQC